MSHSKGHLLQTAFVLGPLMLTAGFPLTPAAAQTQATESAAGSGIEEITVTARKRAESLEDVPDSITAFTSEQIAERRLNQIGDFLALTPNVNLVKDQDAATNIITIRGIGSNRNQAAAVAFVVDGVIIPDSDAFTVDLTDAERVEVLKGPQGALYGKGAIAGAINITTRTPTNDTEKDFRASYGNGDNLNLYGGVSGPIVADKLVGRISAKLRNFNGTTINEFTGKAEDRDDYWKVSSRLIFTPSEALRFDLTGSIYDQDAGASWYSIADVLGTGGGAFTRELADTNPNFDGAPHFTKRKVHDAALTVSLDTGIGTITSISAYDKVKVRLSEELDWSPLAIIPSLRQNRRVRGLSQELRFTSRDATPLRYIVGAYYQNTERRLVTNGVFDLCVFLPGNCVPPTGAVTGTLLPVPLVDTLTDANQYAAFAQVNYDIADNIELTLALRYDRDEREQDDFLSIRRDKAVFSDWQPKASLAYHPTDNTTVYATYSQGYKSGSFNPPPGPSATYPLVVEQEGTDNFEAGFKGAFFRRHLLFNSAAFYTKHKNPQVFQFDAQTGGQYTINAERVRLVGLEFDLVGRITDAFDVNAAFGYTDSSIREFDGSGRYIGQHMPNMPKYTANIGAQYRVEFGNGMTLTPRVDYSHYGRTSYQDFRAPDENTFVYQPNYGTLDAQLALASEGGWTLTAYGKNLTSTNYVTAAFSRYAHALVLVPLGADLFQIDPGTQVGVELRMRF